MKGLFLEGLISAYFRRGLYTEGNLRFKIGSAYTGREMCVSKLIGPAYSWKEVYVIMSVICSKFLLKLVMRTWIFLKLRHVSTLSILDRGNPGEIQATFRLPSFI